MTETSWIPGLVVLGVGMGLGVFFVLFGRKGKEAAPPKAKAQGDLDQRYELLLGQLRALKTERAKLGEEQYAEEKSRLERAAADLLRQKSKAPSSPAGETTADQTAAVPAPAATPSKGLLAQRPALAGALWGGAAVLFFVGLGLMLSQEAKPRQEGMSMSGGDSVPGPMGAAPDGDPHLSAMLRQLESNPNDVEVISAVVHELIFREQFDQAAELAGRAVGLDPYHLEARVHRAALKAISGEPGPSLEELEVLANSYPESFEALLFAGSIADRAGQPARALAHFERYAALTPADQQPPKLSETINALKARVSK